MNTSEPSQLANKQLPEAVDSQRLLVPVDFSVGTLETLCYARALSEKSGGVVDVLHVVPYNLGRNEEAMPLGLLHTMANGARQELQRLVGILRKNDTATAYSVRVREGRAHEVILREASATNATLIIMGIRHRSWLSTLFRRHTVKHVLQNAPCPVLVLRAGQTQAKATKATNFKMPGFMRSVATG
jgi:nucleotide-binding universal stress UspA family protein